jgi:hypothetical protein
MALTLSQCITEVRDLLNEPTEVFWSDTEITNWIKEGCRDFSSKSLMVEAEGQITLGATKLSYSSSDAAFIANIVEPYAALYNNGSAAWKGLIKIHPRMIGNEATNTAGDPKYYCLHNKKIYIWPTTSAALVSAGAYITLLYATETDSIVALADEFQHIPLLYAKAKCKYKDQKFAEGNALMAMYNSFVAFERQDKHEREQDTMDMFKIKTRSAERAPA